MMAGSPETFPTTRVPPNSSLGRPLNVSAHYLMLNINCRWPDATGDDLPVKCPHQPVQGIIAGYGLLGIGQPCRGDRGATTGRGLAPVVTNGNGRHDRLIYLLLQRLGQLRRVTLVE